MKNKKTLSTGEFAKFCKTTKETLFHYDKENLLKPKYVSENGYRYYGPEQFFDFDMIAVLKDTGSSLREIRTALQELGGESFLALLEEKSLAVKRERDRLENREIMLNDMINCTREALSLRYDTFMVLECEEERLEALPIAETPMPSAAMPSTEYALRFAEYLDFYHKEGREPRNPLGIILDREAVTHGDYQERYFFSRGVDATSDDHLHIKPKGGYAVLAHKGTAHTHLESFQCMVRRITASGLAVVGDAYVYDMMSYALLGNGEIYSAKYCILVS